MDKPELVIGRLESLVELSEQGEDIFFDTGAFEGFNGFNFRDARYKKLNKEKLKELCNKLDLFYNFVKGERVFTIKEVLNEIRTLRIKLDIFKSQAKRKEGIKYKRIDHDPASIKNIKKSLFYVVLDKFKGIFKEVKKSIYVPENKEIYEILAELAKMSYVLRDQEPPSITDRRLIAVGFYRSLEKNLSTIIVGRDKDLFNLLVKMTKMINFNSKLYSQIRKNQIKLYRPWMEDEGRYNLSLSVKGVKTYSNQYVNHRDEVKLALEGISDLLFNSQLVK